MKHPILIPVALAFGVLAPLPVGARIIYEPYTIKTIAGWGSNEHTVDGPPDKAQFADPHGLAVDKNGNIYVAEIFGHTIRKVTPEGVASTFAGKAGESGSADGIGRDARFSFPKGVAVGSDGSIYVADYYNQTIRKISRRGVVTTLAGLAGIAGFVDGVGSGARFNGPSGVAVNKFDEVFVADSYNYAIRKIAPDGTVTTFAGGTAGYKDGVGTDAEFNWPGDVAADKLGNLYVTELGFNYDVRKITPDAVVSTLASDVSFPNGLTADKDGNVYVANGLFINKISPTGEVTDFAGGRFGSEDGAGLDAQFAYAMRIAIDHDGNFYVSDAHEFWGLWSNEVIRKITPDAVVTTFCGVSDMGSRDDTGKKARFFWPRGVVANAARTLYVADSNNSTIRRITRDRVVTTIAGKVQTPGYVDGTAADARFNNPWAMALDTNGNLFIADQGNNVIRKMTPAGQVSTVANGYNFSAPSGVAVDGSGNIYVSATNNQTLDKITHAGEVSVLAGSPGQKGSQDGTGSQARFNDPAGIALDTSGNIYVADMDNDSIRKVTAAAVVTTLAGGSGHGSNDGIGSEAQFRDPAGVAVDSAGNVYVTDYTNATLRKVTPAGGVTTLAGSPLDTGWVDETGDAARLSSPYGITVDDSGNLYFADVFNDTIRKGSAASQ